MTSALEKESENGNIGMTEAINIYAVFIEMAQNIMNYSRSSAPGSNAQKPEGLIMVGRDPENSGRYYIQSQNAIMKEDREKIESKLIEISGLDAAALKKPYRELRRSGQNTHEKGGGIGLYEIAKAVTKLQYAFQKIDNSKVIFELTGWVEKKKKD